MIMIMIIIMTWSWYGEYDDDGDNDASMMMMMIMHRWGGRMWRLLLFKVLTEFRCLSRVKNIELYCNVTYRESIISINNTVIIVSHETIIRRVTIWIPHHVKNYLQHTRTFPVIPVSRKDIKAPLLSIIQRRFLKLWIRLLLGLVQEL